MSNMRDVRLTVRILVTIGMGFFIGGVFWGWPSTSIRAQTTAGCQTADIEIKQLERKTRRGGHEYLVGELVNHCKAPIGINLQVTFRDVNGKVAHTEDFWPASVRNVNPGESLPFTAYPTIPANTTMTAKVIAVRQWSARD